MPGRRNYAKERALHAAQCAQRQSELYHMLREQLPDLDRVLVGWPTILEHLRHFGLRRLNRGPLTQRIVQGWIARHGFPVVRGNRQHRYAASPVTSSHAITAWTLTRFHNGDLFDVAAAPGLSPRRSFTASLDFGHAA